jgi:hypothetical protein
MKENGGGMTWNGNFASISSHQVIPHSTRLTHNFQVERLLKRTIPFFPHHNVVSLTFDQSAVLESSRSENHLTDSLERIAFMGQLQIHQLMKTLEANGI